MSIYLLLMRAKNPPPKRRRVYRKALPVNMSGFPINHDVFHDGHRYNLCSLLWTGSYTALRRNCRSSRSRDYSRNSSGCCGYDALSASSLPHGRPQPHHMSRRNNRTHGHNRNKSGCCGYDTPSPCSLPLCMCRQRRRNRHSSRLHDYIRNKPDCHEDGILSPYSPLPRRR